MAKRAKVTEDTRSSSNSDADTSVAVRRRFNSITKNMKDIVASLSGDTKTEAEAIKNMGSLKTSLDGSKPKEKCQELFDLEGFSTILDVIDRFKTSAKLVELGLWALFCITYHLKEVPSNLLIRWNFHDTIPSLANRHIDSDWVQTNAALTFKNLAINSYQKNKLATEEIIQFMRNLMITFPDNEYIVCSACEYFYKMSEIPELKYRLLKNKVALPLVAAYEKFWKDDDNDSDEDGLGEEKDDDNYSYVGVRGGEIVYGLGGEIVSWSQSAVFNLFS